MLSYLKGTVADKGKSQIVIDVGGVGFKVYTSATSLCDRGVNVGSDTCFYTYLYIKEGIMDLYGFSTKEELELFELLISVSGVGAKGALAVLSLSEPKKIALCIVSDDALFIKKASGIGAKTAQRICLELKDKISNEALLPDSMSIEASADIAPDVKKDAADALCTLGYSRQEAQKAVSQVKTKTDDVEVLIKAALKNLF